MSKEVIARLRAELDLLAGPARLPVLVQLGQALIGEYQKTGAGTPAAKPDLDASIDALNEAYGHTQLDDPMRGMVAALLGYQLSIRFAAHGGSERDRDTAIHVLEEALSFPNLTPVMRGMTLLMLGQTYLAKASVYLQVSGFGLPALSPGGTPAQGVADVDRAVTHLRELADGPPLNEQMISGARTLLEMAEVLRTVLTAAGGGPLGADIGRLSGALATMQNLTGRMRQGAQGYGLSPTGIPSLAALLATDPQERPLPYVQGAAPVAPQVVPAAPVAPPAPAVGDLRRKLHEMLPGHGDSNGAVWLSAARLLLSGTPPLDITTVDDMVALASTLVEGAPASRGSEQERVGHAVDAYILAVAFLLRDRLDESSEGEDRRAGAEELLSAARDIPLDHPAATVILRSLGAFLDQDRPMDGVLSTVAGGFADRLDGALAVGGQEPADLVALHALRCLCLAERALADLRRAAGSVPAEYPWLATIKAAGRLAGSPQ
ncbi:hypothetical protein [Allorhizocola rhizosphaerae]|uniref:hypothetical protein n=1 Tax=Allorhizocola rhizosphaerae TaxID=1872709 RepID=UPI000E3CB682|nr:hypothetical protein [Allorhizocola rhizosphaerae]